MKRQAVLLAWILAAVTAAVGAQFPSGIGVGQQGAPMPGPGQPNRPGMPGPTPGMPGDQANSIPQQPTVDDSTLQRQVHEQLMRKPELADVQVSVKGGVVYLSGSVPSKPDRKQARKLAESVPGVRGIKDKVTVKRSAAGAPASAPLSTTGATNPGAPTVNAGGATGTAASSAAGSMRGIANSAAPATTNPSERTTGEAGAKNAETTESAAGPNGEGFDEGSDLAPQIQRALRNEPSLANDDLQVRVVGDQIILDGTVASGKEKQNADRIAASFAANRRVVDHITINP